MSVPPDPTELGAGQTGTVAIRVVNAGVSPVTVTIGPRGVALGDNGRVAITRGTDPLWNQRVQFSTTQLTIPAQSYAPVNVTVHMPPTIASDLYFLGFVVTPVVTSPNQVQVVNEIGSFITIDVPGPRIRKLSAGLRTQDTAIAGLSIPGVVIGDRSKATLWVRNTGPTAVRFWGETDTSASPGKNTVVQQRIDKSLLPVGRIRTYQVSGTPNWPIGFVTVRSTIVYPGTTETSTTQIVAESKTLVVSPWALVALAVLLILALAYWRHRRRRRRPPARDSKRVPQKSIPPTKPVAAQRPMPSRAPKSATPSRSNAGTRPGRRSGVRRWIRLPRRG